MKYLVILIILSLVFYFVFRQYHRLKSFGEGEEAPGTGNEVTGGWSPDNVKTESQTFAKGPYNGRIVDINSRHYQRILLVQNTSVDYLLGMLREFGSLSASNTYDDHLVRIAQHGNWHVLVFDEKASFFYYHNLVGWLFGYEDGPNVPKNVTGYSIHKFNQQRSYLFYLDPKTASGDTAVGTLESGESFFIYFPESHHEMGNLAITADVNVSMPENKRYLSDNGMDLTVIGNLVYQEHPVRIHS